jgi:hypothetical protein
MAFFSSMFPWQIKLLKNIAQLLVRTYNCASLLTFTPNSGESILTVYSLYASYIPVHYFLVKNLYWKKRWPCWGNYCMYIRNFEVSLPSCQ